MASARDRRRRDRASRKPKPAAARLAGVKLIRPIVQGELDGLCGLYAIINAIRLVLAPYQFLTDQQERALFQMGIQYIDESASLSRTVSRSVGQRLWPRLARSICSHAQCLTPIRIRLEHPLSGIDTATAADVTSAIEAIIADGKAAMVFMRGAYKHYSVVCGYTPYTLRLFDSFGYYRVQRASCGSAEDPVSLHRFHVKSLIAVAAKP